ncbi:MAG: glycosyltransferase family 4 protein, partial [Vicinamibacterales bacterium]
GRSQDVVVLYAGLHGLAQGLEQVVRAAGVLQEDTDFQFVLMGDGPEKGDLVQQAREQKVRNVRFLDPRPADEIPAYLAAADVVLISLKTDIPGAVPSKLYEAMASGRPVVLVARGEAADIVNEHQAGMAVDPGDVAGIARALRALRADAALRQRLGENGRRAAERHFNRTTIATRFIDYLEAQMPSAELTGVALPQGQGERSRAS